MSLVPHVPESFSPAASPAPAAPYRNPPNHPAPAQTPTFRAFSPSQSIQFQPECFRQPRCYPYITLSFPRHLLVSRNLQSPVSNDSFSPSLHPSISLSPLIHLRLPHRPPHHLRRPRFHFTHNL